MPEEKKEIIKEYSNGEVTIVWKPDKCMHASYCWTELPEVFDPKKRPWVNPLGADSEQIIRQVNRCPSGALSYYENNKKEAMENEEIGEVQVEPTQNGPLLITGMFELKNQDGTTEKKSGITAFCRCGGSQHMPFCDGTHLKNNFKG